MAAVESLGCLVLHARSEHYEALKLAELKETGAGQKTLAVQLRRVVTADYSDSRLNLQ